MVILPIFVKAVEEARWMTKSEIFGEDVGVKLIGVGRVDRTVGWIVQRIRGR